LKAGHTGEAMRFAREKRGVQQNALAAKLRMSPPCLSKIECGRQAATPEVVAGYVCALGCPELADLYCRECPVAAARARFMRKEAA